MLAFKNSDANRSDGRLPKPKERFQNVLEHMGKAVVIARRSWSGLPQQITEPVNLLIDTPPPYTDRHLHLHHAMPHVIAETLSWWMNSLGVSTLIPQGFDCHSIELELEKQGDVESCEKEVEKRINHIKRQFDALGYKPHWSHEYRSTDNEVRALCWEVCRDLADRGMVYWGQRWLYRCRDCGREVIKHQMERSFREVALDAVSWGLGSDPATRLLIRKDRNQVSATCLVLVAGPDHLCEAELHRTYPEMAFDLPVVQLRVPELPSGCLWPVEPEASLFDLNLHFRAMRSLGRSYHYPSPRGRVDAHGTNYCTEVVRLGGRRHRGCGGDIRAEPESAVCLRLKDHRSLIEQAACEIEWIPRVGLVTFKRFLEDAMDDWPLTRLRRFGVRAPFLPSKGSSRVRLVDTADAGDSPLELPFVLDTMFITGLSATLVSRRLRKPPGKIVRLHRIASATTWHYRTIVLSVLARDVLCPDVIVSHGYLIGTGRTFKERVRSPGDLSIYLERFSMDPVRWWALKSPLGRDRCMSESEMREGIGLVKSLRHFVSRITTPDKSIPATDERTVDEIAQRLAQDIAGTARSVDRALRHFDFRQAAISVERFLRRLVSSSGHTLDEATEAGRRKILKVATPLILGLSFPFLPATSEALWAELEIDSESLHQQGLYLWCFLRADPDKIKQRLLRGDQFNTGSCDSARKEGPDEPPPTTHR